MNSDVKLIDTGNRHGKIWPEIYRAIDKKYQVLLWCDLLANDLDVHLTDLYNTFLPFKNFEFGPQQRLIIHHRDTDYYTNLDAHGFTMWNLYKLLNYLNIPSEFVILVTAFSGIQEESTRLAKSFNISPMTTIYCPYQWCPEPNDVIDLDIQIDQIEFPFVCLNGMPRNHRLYALSRLKDLDMFDQGMISLWSTSDLNTRPKSKSNINPPLDNNVPIPKGLGLRGCNDATRINEFLILNDDQQQLYHHWCQQIPSLTHPKFSGLPNDDATRYQPKFLQYALWNIVNETVGEYPYAHMSEKTVKAILTKRPFIINGGRRSLRALKNLGFKTFDQWIDEEYDNYQYFADRCDRALIEIKRFCSMTPAQLQDQCQQMQAILEYNFTNYVENFGNTNVANFINHLL